MSSRLHWLEVSLGSTTVQSVVDYLLSTRYSSASPNGFRVHAVTDEVLEATHHQRVYWEEVVEDPAGETYTIKRVRIISTNFILHSRRGLNLLLIDPPRTVVPMLTDLSLRFTELSSSKRMTDTRRWIEQIHQRAKVLRHELYSYSNIRVGETMVSHAVSVVGEHDLRSGPLEVHFADSSPKAIRFSMELSGQTAAVEIFSDCRANILSGDSQAVRAVLSDALAGAR